MSDLTADELLNLALLAILQGREDDYRVVAKQYYCIGITGPGQWPEWRDKADHLEACPETTVSAAAGEDREVGTHTVAVIEMTVTCPHVGSATAQLDTYGHLAWLLDEMHRIGEYLKPCEEDSDG